MARKASAKERQDKKESTQHSGSQAGKEILLLWAILGEGGGKDVSRAALGKKGMLPSDDKKARDGLEKRGLITVEQRKTRNDQGRSIRGTWLAVTDEGLAWADENLAAVPAKMQAAAPILQAWLARLSIHLQARQMPIDEFLGLRRSRASAEYGAGPDSPVGMLHEDSPPAAPHLGASLNGDYDQLRVRIRQAYLAVTGNRTSTRARLSDIRRKLNDIESSALDAALKRMQRDQQATLYPLDNKVEITDADRDAAIYFGSEPRHLLWIER